MIKLKRFQSVRSRSTHSLSHPTTSPVSFGPIGSPSVSGSLIPEGAVSSPGLMSDVAGSGSADPSFCAGYPSSSSGGRVQTPPGLPLTDPPRVTGAYGVPAYDPDFGLGSRGANVEPKASIPPPPPRDPYVQLLESQSAMSMLMMQMAREMNQRSQQLLQPQQQPQQVFRTLHHNHLKLRGSRLVKLDQLAKCEWTKSGYRLCRSHHGRHAYERKRNFRVQDWLEKFSGWLCLIQDAYGPELAEAINATYRIQPTRSPEQTMRSKRLFHLLQQNFVATARLRTWSDPRYLRMVSQNPTDLSFCRLIRMEFSLMSRTEALNYREQCLKFRVRRGLDQSS